MSFLVVVMFSGEVATFTCVGANVFGKIVALPVKVVISVSEIAAFPIVTAVFGFEGVTSTTVTATVLAEEVM